MRVLSCRDVGAGYSPRQLVLQMADGLRNWARGESRPRKRLEPTGNKDVINWNSSSDIFEDLLNKDK